MYRNGVVRGINFEFEGVCEVGAVYEGVCRLRTVKAKGRISVQSVERRKEDAKKAGVRLGKRSGTFGCPTSVV